MLSASSITIPDTSLEASKMTRPGKTSTADCSRPPLITPGVGAYYRRAVISDSLNSNFNSLMDALSFYVESLAGEMFHLALYTFT